MINELINKLCPTTILLNVSAIGLSLTNVEIVLKIAVYIVTATYTIVKIVNETANWRKKKKD
tara:strand:- start:2333 stop:2518 length:186 start_codon:yes stop_codon:yes gene_type:complete